MVLKRVLERVLKFVRVFALISVEEIFIMHCARILIHDGFLVVGTRLNMLLTLLKEVLNAVSLLNFLHLACLVNQLVHFLLERRVALQSQLVNLLQFLVDLRLFAIVVFDLVRSHTGAIALRHHRNLVVLILRD